MIRNLIFVASLSLLGSTTAHAACAFQNTVPIKTISAGFQAWKSIAAAWAECGNVQSELDQDFQEKEPSALAANPALYQIAGVANETFVPLMNEQTIRPLDDLVAKYGQNLQENQLIRIDGKVMAIAFDVNAQHLMYRKDIFDQLGIAVPKTYDDVLAAAKMIKDANVVQYPLGGTFKPGYNLGEEFVNMYLGFGGSFFDADNKPTVNNEKGVKTVEMLKALSQYMDPEYLVSDSTYVQQQFQQGKIAMANLWASRGGALNDPGQSKVVGKISMAAAPAAYDGGKPATTLWWDGITIPKHINDEQADAAFRVAMEGLDEEMVKAHNDDVIWLVKGYQPGPLSEGAAASAEAGAPSYPANTAMGVMHSALGNHTSDFLTGKKTAEQTLADIEAEYTTGAREKGLIK